MNNYLLTRGMAVGLLIGDLAALAALTYRARKPARIMEKIAVKGAMTARQSHIPSEEKSSPEYCWDRALRLNEGSITNFQATNLVKFNLSVFMPRAGRCSKNTGNRVPSAPSENQHF